MRPRIAFLLALLLVACATGAPEGGGHDTAVAATGADSARWEADIAAFERRDRVAMPAPGGVVFVGSSSIRMWETLAEDFPWVSTINRGFGGSRVRDALHFADRIVVPYRPRAVVFYAGDNDLQEGRTPTQVRDDFAAFAQRVQRNLPQARIAFIAIKPSPARQGLLPQVREANRLVAEYAANARHVAFLDVATPMLDGDGEPRPGLFLDDRLHMNRAGYEIWIEIVGPWLEGLPAAADRH